MSTNGPVSFSARGHRSAYPVIDNTLSRLGSYEIYAVKPAGGEPVTIPPTSLLRWWDAYPTVKASLPFLTAEEVAKLVRDPALKNNDKIAIIDVRRNDHAVRSRHHFTKAERSDTL